MRLKKSVVLLLVALWFGSATALVIGMNANITKAFDHDMRLSMQLMSLDFERQFVDLLQQGQSSNTNTLFHITSSGACFCETLAKPHISTLNNIVKDSTFEVRTLDINELDALKGAVPSTPAVAVVNARNELVYLGPYSRGSGCFGRSGEVNVILEKITAGGLQSFDTEQTQTAVIVTEARGCYCNDAV
jgi:hypothetical protein